MFRFDRVVLVIVLFSGSLSAGSLELIQNGWQSGGPLTVSFSGQDVDLNGQIDLSELSSFQASYQLPGGGSTTWFLDDLQTDGFFFSDPGNFLFAATNANYILIDSGFQGQAIGSVADSFLFPVDQTTDLPTVVPEPGGLACVGSGLMALWWLRRVRANTGRNVGVTLP